MKILSRYRLIYSGVYECTRCRTTFELDANDQPTDIELSEFSMVPPTAFLSCPGCGSPVELREQSIPVPEQPSST